MTLNISLTPKEGYQQVLEEKTSHLQKLLDLTDRDYFEINLILDELCTNIIDNNRSSTDLKIEITINWQKRKLTMVFRDNGVPFDPTGVPAPDTTLPLTKRQAGGLGIFFVKRYSQTFSYARIEDKNQTTVEKKLR